MAVVQLGPQNLGMDTFRLHFKLIRAYINPTLSCMKGHKKLAVILSHCGLKVL